MSNKVACVHCGEVRVPTMGMLSPICIASDSLGHHLETYVGDLPACECQRNAGTHSEDCKYHAAIQKKRANYGRLPEGVKPSTEEVERRAKIYAEVTRAQRDADIERNNAYIAYARGAFIARQMGLGQMQAMIHNQNKDMGWWDTPREAGTLLMLVTSEIAEAMEGFRKDLMDDHLPHRKMAEVELADAMIRIMDMAEFYGFDLAGAIVEKVSYNRTRADHQPGARAEAHGKKF